MSTKKEVIELIKGLPEDVTIDEIMKKLSIRAEVKKAIRQIDDGKGISHEQVKEHFEKWLR
ncbi:hypothetical protein [Scopulibacillus cellulosilyticus]|uniref:Uncharacterized protein n=1 Tax=Scopulibacillus cellulosilyticus TaxID=2665665 RepID=A0ABW2PQ63_9BACL